MDRDVETYFPTCIHEAVWARAASAPEAVAVVCGSETLTYGVLCTRAGLLARRLRTEGVRPETIVGVCLERSADFVVALLGVWAAGGAYVPLDPKYPSHRLRYMLTDSGARWLLTTGATAAATGLDGASVGGARIDMDDPLVQPRGLSPRTTVDGSLPLWNVDETLVDGVARPENLGYVIYTSGSTGQPKGVMATHAGVMNLVKAQQQAFHVTSTSRVLQFAALSFDAVVSEVAVTLASGAALYVIPATEPGLRMPGSELVTFMRAHGITHVTFPPSALAVLPDDPTLPQLESLVVAGEALPRGLVSIWAPRAKRLLNAYGPTEASVCATISAPLTGADGGANPPIGRPIVNARTYVLDEEGSLVPVGVPGELFVGGAGVTRGYLHRPSLTSERFVPDPFSTIPGARLFRTGDRVRWRADGQLEFLGRFDEQIKLRGFRIEPGEIEETLRQAPEVALCAVVLREMAPGDNRLVAYVVVRDDASPGNASTIGHALRAFLSTRLPHHMVPAHVVVVKALPLTPSGKLDRRALPAPPSRQGDSERTGAENEESLEELIRLVWAAVLHRTDIGPEDNFFDLGGSSLSATQAAARIGRALGLELDVGDMFEAQSIRELSARLRSAHSLDSALVAPPLRPRRIKSDYPPSFAQEGLWFLDRWTAGGAVYNASTTWRLQGTLDVEALSRALGEIVRRHEVLRSAFRLVDGELRVATCPPFMPLQVVELLPSTTGEPRDVAVWRVAQEEICQAFDLAGGRLLRARLLRSASTDHLLVLVLHHIAADAWSMSVLFRELEDLYAAFAGGETSSLPELSLQYGDYAVWQRERLTGERGEREAGYWRRQIGGVPALTLPTDHAWPITQTFPGSSERFALASTLAARIRALAREENATPFMVLLAAFELVLGRLCGQNEFVLGTPIAGRLRPEVEDLIGMFVNTLPLRADLGGDPTFRELVHRVRTGMVETYAHQEFPFERIVAEVVPSRDPSRPPLVRALFAYQETTNVTPRLAGLSVSAVMAETKVAKFPLALVLDEGQDGALSASLTFNTDLFAPGTIAHLAATYQDVLTRIVAAPASALSVLLPETASVLQQQTPAAGSHGEGMAGELLRALNADPGCLESLLVSLWCRILRVDRADPDDDFFQSGGDSLSAARFIAQAQRLFPGAELTLQTFFRTPTIAAVTALVAQSRDADVAFIAEEVERLSNRADVLDV